MTKIRSNSSRAVEMKLKAKIKIMQVNTDPKSLARHKMYQQKYRSLCKKCELYFNLQ